MNSDNDHVYLYTTPILDGVMKFLEIHISHIASVPDKSADRSPVSGTTVGNPVSFSGLDTTITLLRHTHNADLHLHAQQ